MNEFHFIELKKETYILVEKIDCSECNHKANKNFHQKPSQNFRLYDGTIT